MVAAAPSPTFCFVLLNIDAGPDVDAFLPKLADSLNESLNQHFAPFHGGSYVVRVGASPSDRGPTEIGCNVRKATPTDPPGALGWHQVTNGVPDIELPLDTMSGLTGDSNALDVVADHEVKETSRDAGANQLADNGNGKVSAVEACDRVEDTTYPASNGLNLSNFLLPAAWIPGACGPYDYLGVLPSQLDANGAVTKTPGGYDIEATTPTDETDAAARVVSHAPIEGPRAARKAHWTSRTHRRGARL